MIEDLIKKELENVVSNVVVVGEGRKYLTCLITLKVCCCPESLQPTDQLQDVVIDWAKGLGCNNNLR